MLEKFNTKGTKMTDKNIKQPHDPAIIKLVLDAFKQAGCGKVELDDVFSSDLFAAEESYYVLSDVVMYLEKELNMVLPFEEDKGFSFVYGCVDDVVSYVEKKLKEANKTYSGSKNVPTSKVTDEKSITPASDIKDVEKKVKEANKTYTGSKNVNHARDIKELILYKICEQMGTGVQDIEMNDNLHDDLGMDSLDLIEIVMKLEMETMVELPDEPCRMLLFGTVDDMVAFVEHELKKSNKTYTGTKPEPQIKTMPATSHVFGTPVTEPKPVTSKSVKPFNFGNWVREKFRGLVH